MKDSQKSKFKTPSRMLMWIDAALKHEKLKYEKVPVTRDLIPEYEMARGWGFVVAGYSLLEQSLKALLHLRGKEAPLKHSLTDLFEQFDNDDRALLREYYSDFKATAPGMGGFPFETLEDFIRNLDGDPNKKGTDHIGSFDWRYSPIEEAKSETMPTVSIDYLHELIYGCKQMFQAAHTGNAEHIQTNSWRLFQKRKRKIEKYYRNWCTMRMSSERRTDLGDRVEILWGPDYRDWYDWWIVTEEGAMLNFSKLPEDLSVPVVDKRKELSEFNAS